MTITVDIHEAETQLSRLVDQAARGQEFIIAKAGKPMVRVMAIRPPGDRRGLAGLAGAYSIPAGHQGGLRAGHRGYVPRADVDGMPRSGPRMPASGPTAP